MIQSVFLFPVLYGVQAFSQSTTAAASVASQYGLSTSTSLPFPQSTQSNSSAQSFISSNWGLSKGRVQNGGAKLAVDVDPFPNAPTPGSTANSSVPVLQVQYPAGSYEVNSTGGAQCYAMWDANGSAFQNMLIMYEVAFDPGLIRIPFSGTFRSTESTRLGGEGLLKKSYVALRSVGEYNVPRDRHSRTASERHFRRYTVCETVANQLRVDVLRLLP